MIVTTFERWISTRDVSENWITVAQDKEYTNAEHEYDFFTTSILTQAKSSNALLKGNDWFTEVNFGNPDIGKLDNTVYYYENSSQKLENIKLEPFIIYRTWPVKFLSSRFEIIQDFILFYNLFFDRKEHVFKALHESGEEIDVVKISAEENDLKIEIRADFLRNYLKFKDKILIRQHDHRICSVKETEGSKTPIANKLIKNSKYVFLLTTGQLDTNSSFFGRLHGKDIILPYDTQRHILGCSDEYCEFIIGINNQGEKIKSTCEEGKFTNGAKFLTPVFFDRKVLKKYYDMHSKYTVEPMQISCGSLWNISIDTNYENLVQVYLGDLSHIPFTEQQYWALYNMIPQGGLTKSRIKRDFKNEFTDPEDLVFKFKKSFCGFQDKFKNKFGFKLFMPLDSNDVFVEHSLRIPLNNEIPEFETQISYLAKILPDSIDIKSLEKKLKSKNYEHTKLKELKGKKIKMLEAFLDSVPINQTITKELNMIQEIRSCTISHRKGDNYEDLSSKYSLDKMTYIDTFKDLMNNLTISLDNLSMKIVELR